MRHVLLLGSAALALAAGAPSARAEPPPDAEAAKQEQLRKFWQDHSEALRRYSEAARRDAEAELAAHPDGRRPCLH